MALAYRMATLVFASTALLSACSRSEFAEEDLYALMEESALQGQWAEADHYARAYILRNPKDPAGHFYLGFRYLHSDRPWFGVALGQYRMALKLFEENGQENPIARFEDAATFEGLCHLEISKVYQKQLLFLLDAGAPREAFGPLLDHWQEAVDIVREIDPDSTAVPEYDRLIQEFRSYVEELPSNPNGFQLESI